jgi:hypothetical protein
VRRWGGSHEDTSGERRGSRLACGTPDRTRSLLSRLAHHKASPEVRVAYWYAGRTSTWCVSL